MLHHVEINVSDLGRSRDFWEWFLTRLGYELYQDWEKGFSFKQGKTYVVFVQTEARFLDTPYHRKATGLNHLAFHAASPDEVDEMARLLKQKGVRLLYEDRYPHAGGPEHYAVFFEDPDRIKVEFAC